jgi:hypothetical protein
MKRMFAFGPPSRLFGASTSPLPFRHETVLGEEGAGANEPKATVEAKVQGRILAIAQ